MTRGSEEVVSLGRPNDHKTWFLPKATQNGAPAIALKLSGGELEVHTYVVAILVRREI